MSQAVDSDALAETLPQHQLAPLWMLYPQLVKSRPQQSERSHRWCWNDLAPLVGRTEQEVSGADADHRALILAHPAFAPRPKTTARLIAAVQCVLPGERTLEHRHTAAACRLILEGAGGTTYVDGRPCPMHRNDFIITPNWTWHCHANDSGSRAVWLDLLDVPLMATLDTTFGEQGPAASYRQTAESVAPSPQLRWAWADTVAALERAIEEADGSRIHRFVHPADGGPILATLEASVVQPALGRWTERRRTSASAIAVVLEGRGESEVAGEVFEWQERDVFTLPHWQWGRHRAFTPSTRLLIVSEAEALRRLGLLRSECDVGTPVHPGEMP